MVQYNHWHRRSLQPLENWDFLASFLNKGFVGTGPLFLRPRYGFLLYYISTNDQQSYLFLVHRELTRDFLLFKILTEQFRIFVVFTNCTRKQTQPKKTSATSANSRIKYALLTSILCQQLWTWLQAKPNFVCRPKKVIAFLYVFFNSHSKY